MASLRNVQSRAKHLTLFKANTLPIRKGTPSGAESKRLNFVRNSQMYDKLKHVIPGTAIGTALDQLDLKLKEAQSDPLMKYLMCQYKYEQIPDVTKTLVAKGVFEIDQGSTLSYLAACRAAKTAKGEHTKSKDDLEQSPGSGKDNTSTFRSLRSTVSGASAPTASEAQKLIATSDPATKHFDSLLQDHLKASKSPSTTSVVSPSPEPVKAAAHVSPEQSTGEAQLVTETAEAVDNTTERTKVPLKDNRGIYYEKYLEKVYQILKPDLKNLDFQSPGAFQRLRHEISQIAEPNHELKEAFQQHGVHEVTGVSYWLAVRGLFSVDYVRFPRFREAALEASKLLPGYTTQFTRTDHDVSYKVAGLAKSKTADSRTLSDIESSDTTKTFEPSVMVTKRDHSSSTSIPALLETENAAGASKELPPAAPWEPIKIPNMHDIEPSTNRNAIPESRKMKFLASQEVLEIVDDVDFVHNGTVGFKERPQIRLPSLQELESFPDQDAHLNVNGLRLLDYEPLEVPSSVQLQDPPSEIHTPVLVQDPSSVSDPDAHLNVDDLQLLDSEPSKTSAPVPVQNFSESSSSGKTEVVADEQPLKPSKVLFVSGIGRGVSAKHLFKEFADVSPVDFNFDASKRVAVVEFADVEAAIKALEAKHGVFLSGRALNCEFDSESSLNDQVGIPTIASEQPTDDHKYDESSISEGIVVNEHFGTPSKFLYVVGIARSVSIERLFEEFADVSPVDVSHVGSWPYAFFEFTDIEAATKAIKAKHGTFLCGKKLKCMFSRSENPFTKSVGIRTGASKQPNHDHKDDESSISEELVIDERFGTPSQWLFVHGIASSLNIEHLYKEFADFSPVYISFVAGRTFAFVEFSDIEAATKALKAKNGTFLGSRNLTCQFSRSEHSLSKPVGIRTVASKQPIDDHVDEDSSVPEPPKVEDTISAPTTITTDTIAVSTGTTVGTVTQVPEEIMKESVGEAPTDIIAEAVRYTPPQTIADELMLSSDPDPLDQTMPLRKTPKRKRKVQRVTAQSMIQEPAPSSETRLDKSVFETLSKSIKDQAETTTVEPLGARSDDEPLYDGGVYNKLASSSSIHQATFHDLEEDDLVYEDGPSSSDELQSKAYRELLREPSLKKGPLVDRVLPEIRQYATIPVPRTCAYYLPYSSQNRVLSGLQASLEQICFRYLQRKHPELLEETPTRWAIDSAHAFELNRYIYLLEGLIAPNPGVDLGPGGSQSLQALIKSIAGLRHHAVHRFRVDIEALRFWAVDAVRLAELLDDSEAAKQFSSLVSSLEAQQNRMKAEKMKAEEDLLVAVRELAAKRAELLRVEREAMTAYETAHKQLPARTSELDKVIDANIPLHGFGVEWEETSSVKKTSSAKPTSGILGMFKSWFGA